MNKYKLILTLTVLFMAIGVGMAWMVPVPSFVTAPDEFRRGIAVANFSNVTAIATAALFLSGLSGFKQGLKRAYYCICIGLLVQVATTMYYSVASYAGEMGRSIWGDLPITIGAFLIVGGIWQLARILHVRSLLLNPLIIVAYLVGASVILRFIPHVSYAPIQQANYILECLVYPLGALLIWQIIRATTATYSRSFIWMLLALGGNFIATAIAVTASYVTYPSWGPNVIVGAFIIDALIYLGAGYSFATIQQRLIRHQAANTTVDIITFVAALASQQIKVDPILDQLRDLTADLPADSQISAEQEQKLTTIYLQLEDFLTTKEPLRAYTQASIRELVQKKFERLPAGVK